MSLTTTDHARQLVIDYPKVPGLRDNFEARTSSVEVAPVLEVLLGGECVGVPGATYLLLGG